MAPNQPLGEIALNNNRIAPPPSFKTAESQLDVTTETIPAGARQGGDFAVPLLPPASDALSRASHPNPIASITHTPSLTTAPTSDTAVDSTARTKTAHAVVLDVIANMQRKSSVDRDDGSTQSHPRSNTDSQETTMTASTDPAFTPPASDASNCAPGPSSQDSQLLQLSEIAAAQHRIATDPSNSRKRMADGEVKSRTDSQSPVKGHSRNASAVSRTSATAGGHIGELSNELRTRLSYAMIKVNKGWQSNSLEEVENMASQAASPVSSTSTINHRQGSSASPRIPMDKPPSSSAPLPIQGSATQRRKSNTPPNSSWNKPALAPPASIRPSVLVPSSHANPRRNSHPNRTPNMLIHSHSASPHTPGQPSAVPHGPKSRVMADPVLMSPHQNVREQDAIETLLFMSSPGNSANLKHAFSPTGSPGPNAGMVRPPPPRHALPSGPRKPLPTSQRQAQPARRAPYDKSPMAPPPGSPMDLDSPQQHYAAQSRAAPRRRTIGGRSQLRGTLSLPSGIGIGGGKARKPLRDEDIERMLDKASAEAADSSDDEEILIPRRAVAGVIQS
ncbi:hypothetical protein F53441_6538 [Fusarium austroafricanum]|uniref:Cyclin-dependent kinase n=1 Tax=Fusarium austroafricanum TaxID=2364996 RepID=A0A8H4NZD8_9HYPO|nr:hypothetical protein F53441_6538 [Fusarium austroafricanum]